MRIILACVFILFACVPAAQSQELTWWNPEDAKTPIVEGQAWASEVENFYDRFPARAKESNREAVWKLSTNSAGLIIRFHTNAPDITIRYGLELDYDGSYAMTHFPATGVSGLDLYALNEEGDEVFAAGQRAFADTSSYRYRGLYPFETYKETGTEYRLYLPLYNRVTWMEIGVDSDADFEFLARRDEKPIVIYGTSIAQGGCASRPGMAWPAILSRELNRPVVNLGFSGNCHMDKDVIELLAEIDAEAFAIDCLPNLDSDRWTDDDLNTLISESIDKLALARPETPLLLVEHSGFTQGETSPEPRRSYERVNKIQSDIFAQSMRIGRENVFYLNKEGLGLSQDGTVDGIHPNDLGMMQIAKGYEKRLRELLEIKE